MQSNHAAASPDKPAAAATRHATIMKPTASATPTSSPRLPPSPSPAPARKLELVTIAKFQKMWSCRTKAEASGSGGGGAGEREGVTWYRPIPPPGYAIAGDVVRPYLAASPRFYLEAPVFALGPFPPKPTPPQREDKTTASGGRRSRAKRDSPAQPPPVDHLAKPVDFEVVWRHEGGVRGMLPCTIWRPVPPPSFVAVGCILTLTHNKPSPDCVVCLHESLVVPAEVEALVWASPATPGGGGGAPTNSNKKDRTLTRARSERDVTAHATATFMFGGAEEVYGKPTSDSMVVCSVKPRQGDDDLTEPAIAIGCSLAVPVSTTDGGGVQAPAGAACCLRRSMVTHAIHNASPYSSASSTSSSRPKPIPIPSSSSSLPVSPVSSQPPSPSSSFSMPSSLSSSPSASTLSTDISRLMPHKAVSSAATAESPRRLRSVSNPPRRSPSHSSLSTLPANFTSSSSSLRSHRSASHAVSPPRSSKRVTHMLDRPLLAGYSITFAPPSPSLPSIAKPAGLRSPLLSSSSSPSPSSPSASSSKPTYRISSLLPRPPSSSSSSPSSSSSSFSSSGIPGWPLGRLSASALYAPTGLASPPSLVAGAGERRHTIGVPQYECPRCHGLKGQGPFGPCPLNSIHYTHMCELCEGYGSVEGASELCQLCEGEGGFGLFGKCRSDSLHFRPCVKCHGRGFLSSRDRPS